MKIACWNVNSIKIRLPQLLEWLKRENPDVVALQETKTLDELFPLQEIHAAGYEVILNGQKTYNGVAILSKLPIHDVSLDIPDFNEQKRVIAATIAGIRVINVYVPNGESVDSAKYEYKLNWLRALKEYLRQELKCHENLVVLGDFNIAPEEQDVHNPARWEGSVLFSEPERAALKELFHLHLYDAFRLFAQPEKSFSWWDYRMLSIQKNMGLRIDLILISKALVSRCLNCTIDKPMRKLERPSDHAPVITMFS